MKLNTLPVWKSRIDVFGGQKTCSHKPSMNVINKPCLRLIAYNSYSLGLSGVNLLSIELIFKLLLK